MRRWGDVSTDFGIGDEIINDINDQAGQDEVLCPFLLLSGMGGSMGL